MHVLEKLVLHYHCTNVTCKLHCAMVVHNDGIILTVNSSSTVRTQQIKLYSTYCIVCV